MDEDGRRERRRPPLPYPGEDLPARRSVDFED
jgi:hypothetical protein